MSNILTSLTTSVESLLLILLGVFLLCICLSLLAYCFYIFASSCSIPPFNLFFYSSEWPYSKFTPYYRFRNVVGPIKVFASLGFLAIQIFGLFSFLFFIKDDKTRMMLATIMSIPFCYILMSSYNYYTNLAKHNWDETVRRMEEDWAKLIKENNSYSKYRDKFVKMRLAKGMSLKYIIDNIDEEGR